MNGILFTELMELTEENFGYQLVDKIILETNLPSDGIYTAASDYDASELHVLITQLENRTNYSKNDLILLLGKRLFVNFKNNYNSTLLELESSTANLILIENFITTTLRKLYDKLNQPKIEIAHYSINKLVLNCHIDNSNIPLISGFLVAAIDLTNSSIVMQIEKSQEFNKGLHSFILTQTV